MSRKLFSRNEEFQRLRADGYYVQIIDEKFLLIRQVPYVNERREVALGTLVTPLELAGDVALKPVADHQVFFDGDYPCDASGVKMNSGAKELGVKLGRAYSRVITFRRSRPGATPTTITR